MQPAVSSSRACLCAELPHGVSTPHPPLPLPLSLGRWAATLCTAATASRTASARRVRRAAGRGLQLRGRSDDAAARGRGLRSGASGGGRVVAAKPPPVVVLLPAHRLPAVTLVRSPLAHLCCPLPQPCGLARMAWWHGSPPSSRGWWSRASLQCTLAAGAGAAAAFAAAGTSPAVAAAAAASLGGNAAAVVRVRHIKTFPQPQRPPHAPLLWHSPRFPFLPSTAPPHFWNPQPPPGQPIGSHSPIF